MCKIKEWSNHFRKKGERKEVLESESVNDIYNILLHEK